MRSHEAAGEARFDPWQRRALAEQLRRVRFDLGAVVARLDQHQRAGTTPAGGSAHLPAGLFPPRAAS